LTSYRPVSQIGSPVAADPVRSEPLAQCGEEPPRRRPGRPRLEAPGPEYVERREAILARAAEVFEARGYDAGTLEDVAAAMGMRRAGLYHYVSSKSHLLFLLFERAWQLGFERVSAVPPAGDPGERLAALVRVHVSLVAERRGMFTVFFGHRPTFDDAVEQTFRENERRYVGIFARAVRDASEAGLLPAVDPRLGAMALLGMTNWVYKWYDPSSMSVDQIADAFVRMILRGRAG
jgi:TetR/AcrR family transcriptional regulator, cholesterol catabolism regulator